MSASNPSGVIRVSPEGFTLAAYRDAISAGNKGLRGVIRQGFVVVEFRNVAELLQLERERQKLGKERLSDLAFEVYGSSRSGKFTLWLWAEESPYSVSGVMRDLGVLLRVKLPGEEADCSLQAPSERGYATFLRLCRPVLLSKQRVWEIKTGLIGGYRG